MKKIFITAPIIIVMALTAIEAAALPKVTMIDYNCGNTPKYIEKTLKSNNLEYADERLFSKELLKYIGMFNFDTFLIEENDEKALVSIYKGKPIFGARVKDYIK